MEKTPIKSTKSKVETKRVYNRSLSRIEITHNEEVFVFLPGQAKRVPINVVIPEGLGLIIG